MCSTCIFFHNTTSHSSFQYLVGKSFILQSLGTPEVDDNGVKAVHYNSPTLGQIQIQKENEVTIANRNARRGDEATYRPCWVNGVVLCFSLNDRASLDALLDVIVPQMRQSTAISSSTPMYLLGLLDAKLPRIPDAAVEQMYRWLGGVGSTELSINAPPDQVAGVIDFGPFERFRAVRSKRIISKPIPPPRPPVPRIQVPPISSESTLVADLRSLLADGAFSDVELVLHDNEMRFKAHRAVLCVGSELWRAAFGVSSNDKSGAADDDVVASIAETSSDEDGCIKFTVMLQASVPATLVREMLDAIYGDSTPSASCIEKFQLTDLSSGAKSHWIEQNLIFGSLFHDAVICTDDGKEIRAQRALLHARCGFFARLLGGPFVEARPKAGVVHLSLSDVESEVVAQCLRYLLVRHVDITTNNATALLSLAQRLALPRLTALCEDFLVRCIDESLDSVDLFDLLSFAEASGARQLHAFVTRTIACNFVTLRAAKRLRGRELIQMTKLQWPPSDYLLEVEAWESDRRSLISNLLHVVGFAGQSPEHPQWGYAHVKSKPVCL